MHELGIAQSILELVTETIPPEQLPSIRKVCLLLGPLAGVERESLEFCFQAIVRDGPLHSARLAIESRALLGHCASCGRTSALERLTLQCPLCDRAPLTLSGGNELAVTSIELDDDPVEAT